MFLNARQPRHLRFNMSIKDIVRREEEEVNERPPNVIGAGLALAAFFLGIIVFPKYVTRQERKRRK